MGYRYFDAHCDTALKIAQAGETLTSNSYQVSLDRLCVYDRAVQVFAIFNEGNFDKKSMLRLMSMVREQAGDAFVADYCTQNNQKLSALLSVEGLGNQPDFTLTDVKDYANEGVQIASLTWNGDNPLCGGIGENRAGLTQRGREVLDCMSECGMMIDVSHCSEHGFWDINDYWQKPIVATHSNARAICNHPRNLTDKQLKAIFASGGMVGINLYPLFLNGTNIAYADDAVRHIEHMLALGGENCIGLGGDFDGIDVTMTDITSADKLDLLFERLLHFNHKESFIHKLSYGNFDDFFKNYEFRR